MSPILRLQVLLRVPVGVEEDNGVGGGKVNPLAACTGTKEEDLMTGVGVEGLDLSVAVRLAHCAVDPAAVPGAEQGGPVLEDVELGFELGED